MSILKGWREYRDKNRGLEHWIARGIARQDKWSLIWVIIPKLINGLGAWGVPNWILPYQRTNGDVRNVDSNSHNREKEERDSEVCRERVTCGKRK